MSNCEPLTCADLKLRLRQVQDAIHKLMTVGGTQSVAYGDQQVSYSKANIADIRAYENDLAGQTDALCGTCFRRRRHAIQAIPR